MTFRIDPQNYDLILHTHKDEESYNPVATLYTVSVHFVDTINNKAQMITAYFSRCRELKHLSQWLKKNRDILVILDETSFLFREYHFQLAGDKYEVINLKLQCYATPRLKGHSQTGRGRKVNKKYR
jgi:hypothetical protein